MSANKRDVLIFMLTAGLTLGLLLARVARVPEAVCADRMAAMLEAAGGSNRYLHGPPANADFRAVVKPSPNLAYSACVYDVSEAPLAMEFPAHDDFWVNQVVADNTDSVAYTGLRDVGPRPSKFVLVSGDTPPTDIPGGFEVLHTPTPTGVMLLRYLVRSGEHLEEINRAREQIELYTLE
ncbi:MAG: DUF1254 domain-containing protein [Desulfatibacillaceae bacterium]